MRQAGRIFQLAPAPPKVEDINDYIIFAIRENDLNYFTYFLHHYEPRLNKRVYRFLLTEGIDRYDPWRFLDYKLSCVLAMLECLPNYVSDKGADFLTYAHHFIGNALLDCRRQEEAGSFKSLDEYKAARGIAWLYNNSGKSTKEVIAEYAAEQNCTEETAAEYLTLARQNRSRVPFYSTMQDEDSETGRDHIPTRVFKQMARLNKQHDKLAELLSDMKFTNYKERSAQIAAFLEKYIPDVAAMETQMKKYEKFFKTTDGKQKALEKKNDELTAALEESQKESTVKKLQEMRLHSDYERVKGILDRIPPEIIKAYTHRSTQKYDINR